MTLPREVDAVVIGAGPNGLVAANRLADAGWDTLLLEAQPDVGGAVRSDRELHPDFVSDTFSAFYPMAAASRVIQGLHLEDYGGGMPLRCSGICEVMDRGRCCIAMWMSPRACWTRSIQVMVRRGALLLINGSGLGRVWSMPLSHPSRHWARDCGP